MYPYKPTGATFNLTVSTSSTNVELPIPPGTRRFIRMSNLSVITGPVNIFFSFGDSTVTTAVATGTPVLPSHDYLIEVPEEVTHIAGIATAGGTLFLQMCKPVEGH